MLLLQEQIEPYSKWLLDLYCHQNNFVLRKLLLFQDIIYLYCYRLSLLYNLFQLWLLHYQHILQRSHLRLDYSPKSQRYDAINHRSLLILCQVYIHYHNLQTKDIQHSLYRALFHRLPKHHLHRLLQV